MHVNIVFDCVQIHAARTEEIVLAPPCTPRDAAPQSAVPRARTERKRRGRRPRPARRASSTCNTPTKNYVRRSPPACSPPVAAHITALSARPQRACPWRALHRGGRSRRHGGLVLDPHMPPPRPSIVRRARHTRTPAKAWHTRALAARAPRMCMPMAPAAREAADGGRQLTSSGRSDSGAGPVEGMVAWNSSMRS